MADLSDRERGEVRIVRQYVGNTPDGKMWLGNEDVTDGIEAALEDLEEAVDVDVTPRAQVQSAIEALEATLEDRRE